MSKNKHSPYEQIVFELFENLYNEFMRSCDVYGKRVHSSNATVARLARRSLIMEVRNYCAMYNTMLRVIPDAVLAGVEAGVIKRPQTINRWFDTVANHA